MTDVQTALGPVAGERLGLTLAHEHLYVGSAGMREAYPHLFDPETEAAHAAAELAEAREAGVGTIVDVTTPDLGRAPELIREASRRSGVHVVLATGLWLDPPRMLRDTPAGEFAALFAREIEEGIADTGIRAGVIKVANGDPPGVGETEERILRGAAEAAARTRVPITTHTGPYAIGREQMRIFADAGVPPHLVAIGHSFTGDLGYLREVLDGGHYLSIDHFRWRRDIEDEVLAAIAALCAEGRAARLMLSHDHAPEMHAFRPHGPHQPPSGFTYVPREVRAKLERLGVAAADLDAMLVEAPRAFLEGGRG